MPMQSEFIAESFFCPKRPWALDWVVLLLHLSFELAINDDLFLAWQFAVEQLDGDILVVKMESPDELLFGPIDEG